MQPNHSAPNILLTNTLRLLILGMGAILLASCFTPLHVHFDSIRYFNIKDCIEFGCDPDSEVAKDYLPYGYTGLLITLSKLGILNAFTIVFINCLYLFAALYFIKKYSKDWYTPSISWPWHCLTGPSSNLPCIPYRRCNIFSSHRPACIAFISIRREKLWCAGAFVCFLL